MALLAGCALQVAPMSCMFCAQFCSAHNLSACSTPSQRFWQEHFVDTHKRQHCRCRGRRMPASCTLQASSGVEPSLAELQERLDEAVTQENYQAAAELRDKITCGLPLQKFIVRDCTEWVSGVYYVDF